LRREPYRERKKKRQVMDAISFIDISKGFRARNVPAMAAGKKKSQRVNKKRARLNSNSIIG
jgi:hypothetical protein